ncbi:Conserved_hypothetical protein [Hexamita inflata]|uniref:Transmembrane protein n=1 Tax=Hexamita inflata TaxID=28002 RepID=A0AA86NVD8_9EUKA|nr:Conserved hypothetical protein [Hexamita inflata]
MIYEEQISDLTNCFEQLEVKIIGGNTIFIMCPNDNCIKQYVNQNQQQTSAFIKDIHIEIFKFQFQIATQLFVDAYQQQQCYAQHIQISKNDFQLILQESFIDSMLHVITQQNRRLTEFHHKVQINTDSVSDVFMNQFAYLYQNGNDTGYQVIFDYNLKAINKAMQTIETLTYDKMEYKLTGSIMTSRGVQKLYLTKSVDHFDLNERSIFFSCQVKGAQSKTCYQMLINDYTAMYSVPTYNLDIMFFFQNKLIYLLKASNCISRYTCWKYGVAVLTQKEVVLQLTKNNVCDGWWQFYDFSNISTRFMVLNSNYQIIQQVNKYLPIMNSTNISIFKFSCEELDCSQLNVNSIFALEYDFNYPDVFTEKFIFTKIEDTRAKYSISNVVGAVGGSALLSIVLMIVVWKGTKSVEKIREYQGGQIAKKVTEDQKLRNQLLEMLKKQEQKET